MNVSVAVSQDDVVAGLSRSRLQMARDRAERFIADGCVAGTVAAVYRRGVLVDVQAVGWQDKEAQVPMRRDSIFRLASMTKPITSVAVLLLVQDGVISLLDPIDRWIPELADRQVLLDIDGPLDQTRPAARPVLVRDVLMWRTGIGVTQGRPDSPIHQALGRLYFDCKTNDEFVGSLGALPLKADPGATWLYNTSSDIQVTLVARASGMPFEQFIQRRIFDPLGMSDTGFWVPPEKRDRLARSYGIDPATGQLSPFAFPGGVLNVVGDAPPTLLSGAGGLVSTADDYLKFARMLLHGGAADGVRIMAPRLVQAMTTNFLEPSDMAMSMAGKQWQVDRGFGYGVWVHTRSLGLSPDAGAFGWPGASGCWWTADPRNELVALVLMHQFDFDTNHKVGVDIASMIYGAIVD